jgi:integrase/recombinase XerD
MSKINKQLFFMYVKDYFDRLRSELKSERTISAYRESLNDFRKYLSCEHQQKVDKITFEYITPEVVREYISWISTGGRSLNTRNLRLTALKCYVSFCAEKYIELVPLEIKLSKIKTKTIAPKTNNWLNKEQITLILDQPSQS